MIVCLSPGGQNTSVVDAPAESLFVGTIDGVFSFQRKNVSWSRADHFLAGQHISCLLFEAQSKTIFAGTHGGALHASTDWGKSWENRNKGIHQPNIFTLNTQRLGDRVRLYAGTEIAHLFYTDDLGRSWKEHAGLRAVPGADKWTFPAPPHNGHVKNIAFDAKRPEVLYAAVEVGGLFKSTDGGATWRELPSLYPDVHRVVVSATNPERVYAITPSNDDGRLPGLGGICLSENGGDSWQRITAKGFRIGYPDAFIMHPRNESLLFMAGARHSPGTWRSSHFADPRIARSGDGGKNWEIVEEGFPEHIRGNTEAMSMNVWKDGFALFAGTTDGDVFLSDDEGNHWKKIIEGLPPVSKVGHYLNLRAA